MKYSGLIKNRISTSRNQRKCSSLLIFLQKYILSGRNIFTLIEVFIKGEEEIDGIFIASTIIVEKFESRIALLFIYNLVNSRFFFKRRFFILATLRRLSRSSFRVSGFFEINLLKLILKSRRFKIYLFRFNEISDIVATIDLFL